MMAHRTEQQGEDLEFRAREVLREIVMQYVQTGEPISSRSLARCGRFELSPASLRNVMADLEDLGYVFQPHTSAGRVPTDRGYRFFINNLMRSRKLTQHEREVIDARVSGATELDEVMQLASRLLSKFSNQVGLVFMPTIHHLLLRSVDLIPVAEKKVMVVVVGTNGVVVNRIVEVSEAATREELERIGRYLTAEFHGLSLQAIRARLVAMLDEERSREDSGLRRTVRLGIETVDDVMPEDHELYVEGATSILDKPEFSDAAAMRKTFLAFEEKERLVSILSNCLAEDGLQILIGSESPFTGSYNFSLVATRYGAAATPVGLVGIIGPTRMEYGRVAPLVEYLGRALSRKIEESEEQER